VRLECFRHLTNLYSGSIPTCLLAPDQWAPRQWHSGLLHRLVLHPRDLPRALALDPLAFRCTRLVAEQGQHWAVAEALVELRVALHTQPAAMRQCHMTHLLEHSRKCHHLGMEPHVAATAKAPCQEHAVPPTLKAVGMALHVDHTQAALQLALMAIRVQLVMLPQLQPACLGPLQEFQSNCREE